MIFCSNCGSKIEDGEFCPNCGKRNVIAVSNSTNNVTANATTKKNDGKTSLIFAVLSLIFSESIVFGLLFAALSFISMKNAENTKFKLTAKICAIAGSALNLFILIYAIVVIIGSKI